MLLDRLNWKRLARLLPSRAASVYRVDRVSPIVIPDSIPLERDVPAKTKTQYAGRFERYDYKTVFYDIYDDGSRITLSGPPLMNLRSAIEAAKIRIDRRPVKLSLQDLGRTQLSFAERTRSPRELTLAADGWSARSTISRADQSTFAGRRVLIGINKNNLLSWIEDWCRFYNRVHGVDAVLLYDNGSTAYSPQQLLAAIRQCRGIKAAVVVPWPFKFGTHMEFPGVSAHTHYAQTTALNHGRRKYLSQAAGVIQCDIDELIVPSDRRSIFDHLEESRTGVLSVHGRWVMPATDNPADPPSFSDFWHTKRGGRPCSDKWAAIPARIPDTALWDVHLIREMGDPEFSDKDTLYHFRGLNTGWKNGGRATRTPVDLAIHRPAKRLKRVMNRVFRTRTA